MGKASRLFTGKYRQILQSREKLCGFSVIYWSNLLNWIDFKGEIGDHTRSIGGTISSTAKYLILLYFFGKRS